LLHANRLLGYEAFVLSDWNVIGEYDERGGRHRAFVAPKQDLEVEGVAIRSGERVRIEESYKYDFSSTAGRSIEVPSQANKLWQASGVLEAASWANQADDYGKGLTYLTSYQCTKSVLTLLCFDRIVSPY